MKLAVTIAFLVAAPAYGAPTCMSKSSAEMMKDLRKKEGCPNANPTDCKCTGHQNAIYDCPGPEVTLWESTGKKCVKAMSDMNKAWDKHPKGWDYPADTAGYCPPLDPKKAGTAKGFSHWIEPGSYHCTWVKGKEAEHKFKLGDPAYNAKYNSETWCTQPSCYVDPCTCNKQDIQSSSWFKKKDGGAIYYSGQVCGQDFTFKAALCSGQKDQTACEKDKGCVWKEVTTTVEAISASGAKQMGPYLTGLLVFAMGLSMA